jgi:hypothetical protein
MAKTYEPIATTTTSGSATTYTFSSIPSTYTDLVFVLNGQASLNCGLQMRFNGDTATNYSRTVLYGAGSAAGSNRNSSQTSIGIGTFFTAQGMVRIQVQNYANSTTNKTALSRWDIAGLETVATVGLWRSTAAITSATLFLDSSGTWQNGSTLTLYGIKAA